MLDQFVFRLPQAADAENDDFAHPHVERARTGNVCIEGHECFGKGRMVYQRDITKSRLLGKAPSASRAAASQSGVA